MRSVLGSRVRVGIVGLSAQGGWAARAHLPALRQLPDLYEIRGLAGTSLESAARSAERFAVPLFFDDARALAAHPDIDLVVVAVKVPEHLYPVMAAINAGKPVYCEWPIGRTPAEAESMATHARMRGVRSFACLQARSLPLLQELRRIVAAGEIGDVLSTTLSACAPAPWAGEIDARQKFLLDPASGATMLSIPFGHAVDALCWALSPFERVSATAACRRRHAVVRDDGSRHPAATWDQIAVSGILRSGAVAVLHVRGHVSRTHNLSWEINGTDGDILIEGGNAHLQFGQARATIRSDKGCRQFPADPGGTWPGPASDSLVHAYRYLHHDLLSGKDEVPGFDDACVTHRLLERIEQAVRFVAPPIDAGDVAGKETT